ncbi:hypothetical protein [Streptomyces thermoalcalitolerans]
MPAHPPEVNTVKALVAGAAATPLPHNAQPWLLRCPPVVGVPRPYAGPERTLPRTAPGKRAPHTGCGAAPLDPRVAAAEE